ncbi:MAG: arginine--tRNA ligase [archaeon]
MFKEELVELLAKKTGIGKDEVDKLIEIPPDSGLGDYAFPCFSLAKVQKKAPNAIAAELAKELKPGKSFSDIKATGPYLNFFVDKNRLADGTLKEIVKCTACYGSGAVKGEKIMIEYPAPNTNKPLHLGHVRNMLLGNSVCSLLGFAGYTAIPVNYVNDRGVHICKSMLAYQKWGENKEPDKKSDQFVGDFYVLFNQKAKDQPELEEETQELLRRWEAGDKDIIALWKKMNRWALDGHNETYKKFDVHHKKTYLESEIYTRGRDIILDGLKKGLFAKDEEGAIIADLENDGLGKKVLIRKDGTAIYITTDIYLAKLKFDDFKMDRSVYVVGSEQDHHFKVLFKIIEKLGFPYASKCYHLSYGMVNLPEGRMKSREGTVVDADDLYNEMRAMAADEVMKRHPEIDEKELEDRSRMIALGALKFFILKHDPQKDMIYNPKESISFEGETGPYVQYAHARICSIMRQAADFRAENVKGHYEHPKEKRLISLLAGFPAIATEAAEQYRPSSIARYSLDLAQTFNEFYQECPVLKADQKTKESRLLLIFCTRIVLRNALDLLGIQAPEEM